MNWKTTESRAETIKNSGSSGKLQGIDHKRGTDHEGRKAMQYHLKSSIAVMSGQDTILARQG